MTGTCCPVHLSHIQAFVEARQLLLSRGYDVVLAALSLNADNYVTKKLQEKGSPSISLKDRRRLVEWAIQEHNDWLAFNDVGFKDEHVYCKRHEEIYPHLHFDHYLLNGADDVIRRKKWKWSKLRQIVMCRPGITEQLMQLLKKEGISGTSDNFIVGPELPDISSTEVRDVLVKGNQARLLEMLHPDVARWCWEKGPYRPPRGVQWMTVPVRTETAAVQTHEPSMNSTVVESSEIHAPGLNSTIVESLKTETAHPQILAPGMNSTTANSRLAIDLNDIRRLCNRRTAAENTECQNKALTISGEKGKRAAIARETLDFLAQGGYLHPDSYEQVDISKSLCEAVAASIHVPASGWHKPQIKATKQKISVEVRSCTTLEAAQDLACSECTNTALGVLNFASARNPGGGFTNGAEAQEESLARSSGIYPCLTKHFDAFFAPNRRAESGLYTHDMIYSPGVPILRDTYGSLLHEPYQVNFLTAAAPNCGVLTDRIGSNKAKQQSRDALNERIERVLHTFACHGCVDLVLGAWGCGVFRNDAKMVAELFNNHLRKFGCFRRVIFAVKERTGCEMAQVFADEFQCPVSDAPAPGDRHQGTDRASKGKGDRKGSGKGSAAGSGYRVDEKFPSSEETNSTVKDTRRMPEDISEDKGKGRGGRNRGGRDDKADSDHDETAGQTKSLESKRRWKKK
jgi:uncharacterized protein (TIGR02452 family)